MSLIETIGAISSLVSPAILLFWIWYTEKYRPERQRRADEVTERQYKTTDSREQFWQAGEGNTSKLFLQLLETLVANLIAIADGKSSLMIDKMSGLEQQFGILIGFMARQQATQVGKSGSEKWPAIDEILSAAVVKPAPAKAQPAASTATDTLTATIKELNKEQ